MKTEETPGPTRSRRPWGQFISAAVCLGLLVAAVAALESAEISSVRPLAIQPGGRTVLTFSGTGLARASHLWTSFGGTTRRLENASQGQVSFEVSCPAQARGVHAVQLIGPDGASDFQLILADYLTAPAHEENHQSRATALRITPPVAVDDTAKSEQIDFFRFEARAGQSFSIEAIAHRIGSQLDLVVRVLDAAGREVGYCDDGGSVWRDARFRFTAPANGEYLLAVADVGYAGGNNYDYRLRVSDDSLVWFTFPLIDPDDQAVAFEQVGLLDGTPEKSSPANPDSTPRIAISPQIAEREGNDQLDSAQPISAPVILNARIDRPGDRDYFKFQATKNQKIVFQSQTRSLGSPCDLVLTLKKADGTLLARSNPSTDKDASLTNSFSEGWHFLEVRELSGTRSGVAPYRLKIHDCTPSFSLSSENNKLQVKPGGTAAIRINMERFDFREPIELALSPSIAGISLENHRIAANKNEVELKLKVTGELKPGMFHHFRITGAHDGTSAEVSTTPALRKSFPLMLNPPRLIDGIFTLVIQGEPAPPAT